VAAGRFFGLVNFYCHFLPTIAHKLRPLTDALKGDVQGNDDTQWTPHMAAAFSAAKESLNKAIFLARLVRGGDSGVGSGCL
jgi:hypothetical protein